MKRNEAFIILLLALLVIAVACNSLSTPVQVSTPTSKPATPAPLVLTDALGHTITLQKPAQRVVSLAPSNTEILFAIGAETQVVGRDQFSNYPEEAKSLPDIGGSGFGDVNTEAVVSLNPDLVLAAGLTPPELVSAMTDLGLTVFVMPNPTDLTGMYINLLTASKLTGREAEVEILIESLKTRVEAVESKVDGAEERPLVFYELDSTDPNAPWTSGPGTFMDSLITMAGGANVGSVLKDAWAQISLEELVSQDPDIILLGDYLYGGVTPEAVAARPGWSALSAVKDQRVYTFDDDLVSRPGPRLVDGLEALAKLLHPELFE